MAVAVIDSISLDELVGSGRDPLMRLHAAIHQHWILAIKLMFRNHNIDPKLLLTVEFNHLFELGRGTRVLGEVRGAEGAVTGHSVEQGRTDVR